MNHQELILRSRNISEITGIKKDIVQKILKPNLVLEFSIPVKMDSGKIKVFTGFRSQFNNALGQYKGGIRYHPEVSREEVIFLSFLMSLKCALIGLPLGGGKGGVIVNPKELSIGELERLSRGYVRAIYKYLGPDQDVPAPDVYTNAQIMAFMMDEYSCLSGKYSPGSFTGKPIENGGSLGRDIATARGGFDVLLELINRKNLETKALNIAIQGFGNAGSNMAKMLYDKGSKIVGLSDSKCSLFKEDGLDPYEIEKIKKEYGTVGKAKNCEIMTHEEGDKIIEADCDILIFAALGGQVSKNNVNKIKAKIILELANGPIDDAGDKILQEKKVVVIPDILANAGGVSVSYFEMVQNKSGYYWSRDEVLDKLKEKMTKAFEDVWEISKKHKTSLRGASYILAIQKILKAMENRGV